MWRGLIVLKMPAIEMNHVHCGETIGSTLVRAFYIYFVFFNVMCDEQWSDDGCQN